MERIYIGGLDPPQLTAEEVASRLEGIAGIQIRSKDLVGNDKSFFYLNAVSDDEISVLDKIAKQYNNVIWKRCKLVVEAARPHFLERLAQERLQRGAIKEEETSQSRAIPRHLRIRQKYGEEAFPVDTKPAMTSDWSDFSRVVSKLRTRREQHSETMRHVKREHRNEVLLAKKKAFMNRAVHLRWGENSNGESSQPSLVDAVSDASAHDESEDVSSTAHQSDSDDVSGSESRQLVNGKHSEYVWSDDESDESSDEDGTEGIEEHGDRDDAFDEGQTSTSSADSISSESVSSEGEAINKTVERISAQYEWSSEDSDQEHAMPPRTSASLKPNLTKETTEEFSAAIDFSDSSSDDERDNDDSGSNERAKIPVVSTNIDDDVKANLGVLSSLFPDMAYTTPAPVDTGGDNDGEQGETQPKMIQPGWEMGPAATGGVPSMAAGLGMMQRFDPTKESAKKYIIKPSKPSVENEGTDEAEPDSSSESVKDEQAEDSESASYESESAVMAAKADEGDSKTAVYEQNKLENIFREARTSGGGEKFKMSSMFDNEVQERDQSEEAKSFAFGFDVGNETTTAKEPPQQGGTFAFSFDSGVKELQDSGRRGESETSAAGIAEREGTQRKDHETSTEENDQTGESSAGIQRRGLFFPEDTLDEYTNAFFAMNEGTRILQDPQGFLRDDSVKQQWKKERHALTLDWKRKRKYAQSRMQKKMKFR